MRVDVERPNVGGRSWHGFCLYGDDLLHLAVKSMPRDRLNLAYFLPRNTNGWRIGQSAYRAALKTIEMEQNYLNHKLKTITVYVQNLSPS